METNNKTNKLIQITNWEYPGHEILQRWADGTKSYITYQDMLVKDMGRINKHKDRIAVIKTSGKRISLWVNPICTAPYCRREAVYARYSTKNSEIMKLHIPVYCEEHGIEYMRDGICALKHIDKEHS